MINKCQEAKDPKKHLVIPYIHTNVCTGAASPEGKMDLGILRKELNLT